MTRSLRSLVASAIAAAALITPALALDSAAGASTTFGAVRCHTVEGCTEGELHHGEHGAEDHLRHETDRLERGHLF
jgi:hypothetical protein